MPIPRTFANLGIALLVLLLAACGGGSGSASTAIVAPPTISLAGTNFFKEPGQVIVGTPVALSASGASAAVRWRLSQRPASSGATFPAAGAGAGASFVPDVPGDYVVETWIEDGTTSSSAARTTIRAIPNHIEFNLKVVNSNGQTALWVTPVRANAPMSDCLVYTAAGCAAPAQVLFYLDGYERPAYTGVLTQPGQFMYWNPMDTAPLVGTPHQVRAVVTAPGEPGLAGNRREAILTFSVASATQTDPLGGPPTATLDVVGVATADAVGQVGASAVRVGGTVSLTTTTTGVVTGLQPSMHFVDRPAGSTASLTVDSAAATATFMADRVGAYTIEYTPMFADGSRASPAYATALVAPHLTTIIADVPDTTSPSYGVADNPRPAAGVTRVYILEARSTRGVSALQALLDGVSLAQTQIERYSSGGHGGIGVGWYPQPVYDIPASALAGGAHTLVVRVTDTLGRKWEVARTLPGPASVSQVFEDTNP